MDQSTLVLSLVADVVSILIALVAAIGAVKAWLQVRQLNERQEREEVRQNAEITITLQNGANIIEMPVPIRRKDLTRAELLGRIGMIKPAQRFQLESLNTKKFFKDLDAIKDGSGSMTLTVVLTDGDYKQFLPDATKP